MMADLDRARDQLLDGVSRSSSSPALGGYAVISHWLPFLLFSVSAGRARRPLRSAPHHSGRHGAVHASARSRWGVLFMTDTLEVWHAIVDPQRARHRGRVVGAGLAAPDPRHRRPRAAAQRACGSWRCRACSGCLAGRRSAARCCWRSAPSADACINALIYLPLTLVAVAGAVWPRFRARRRRRSERAPGGSRGIAGDRARDRRQSRRGLDDARCAAPHRFVIGNAYPGADAGVRRRPRPRRCGCLLQHAARRQCGRRAGRPGSSSRAHGVRAGASRRPRSCLVIAVVPLHGRLRRVDAVYPLSLALLFAAGFLNLAFGSMAQTLVQLACARSMSRPGDRALQHVLQRHAGVFRRHRRHGRQPRRRALVACAERGCAAGDHRRASSPSSCDRAPRSGG